MIDRFILLLIKGIGSLPSAFLYALSDLVNFILFTLIGYRKKVVLTNLRNSFPEKSPVEIKNISNKFFRFLSDLIVEGLKVYSISEEELRKRMRVTNIEVVNELYDKGKSVIIVCAHIGNFEYGAIRYTLDAKHKVNTVYKPLSNKTFDGFLKTSRSRFGTNLVPDRKTYEVLRKEITDGILSASGLVSDQAPSPRTGYWMEFMNQDTPVFMGCEKISKKYDMAIVYGEVDRIKRGKYIMDFRVLFEDPNNTQPGEITETFTKIIEKGIQRKPELWLWSHKRWKHKMPEKLPDAQKSKKYPVKNSGELQS